MIQRTFYFVMFFLLVSKLSAQSMFYSEYKNEGFDIESRIGHVGLNNCTDSIETLGDEMLHIYTDLTIHPNGNLFGFGHHRFYPFVESALPPSIMEITISETWPINFIHLTFDDSTFHQGIATHPSGVIYLVGKNLGRFYQSNSEYTEIGDLPPEMEALGGFTYRSGKFYLSSISNTLVEVNIENPMNSSVVMTFPSGTPPIHSLTTLNYSCDSIITYATGTQGDSSIVYELDFDTWTLNEVCDIDRIIYGTANHLELPPPECTLFLDLDLDNSSGLPLYDFLADTSCVGGIAIADADLDLFSIQDEVDLITIELETVLNSGMEFLSSTANIPNVTINGIGTSTINIENTGAATFTDMLNAIASISYENTASEIVYGTREVSFFAHQGSFTSQVSTAFLPIYSTGLFVDSTSTNMSCYETPDGIIAIDASGLNGPFEYEWGGGEDTANLSDLSEGQYLVTVSDQVGCKQFLSFDIGEPDLLETSISNIGPDLVCDDSGVLFAEGIGGTPPYNWTWDNGNLSDTNTNITSGVHSVILTDSNDCSATTSFELDSESYQIEIEESLCEGTIFTIDDLEISSDTSFCVNYLTEGGCDSLLCYSIEFNPTFTSTNQLSSCQGDSIFIDAQFFVNDTLFCETYETLLGCDSIICYELNFTQQMTFVDTSICEGDQLIFGNESLETAGTYTNTITTNAGCDSTIVLSLEVLSPLPLSIISEGSFCEDETVLLQSNNDYTSYSWSTGANTFELLIDEPGEYSLTITDGNNCTLSTSISIAETSLLQSSHTILEVNCYGDSDGAILMDTVYGGNPPYLFALDDSVYSPQNTFGNLPAGTYTIYIEDSEGCLLDIPIVIPEPPSFTIALPEDITLDLGDSLSLEALGNQSVSGITWMPSTFLSCDTCLNTIAKPLATTAYRIEAYNEEGCIANDEMNIIVNKDIGIYIPSAFSPNEDGYNDLFYLQSKTPLNIKSFSVYNRWGANIYQVKDVMTNISSIGWDGNYKSDQVPEGVYAWFAEVLFPDDTIHMISGEVTVLR